MKTEKYQLDLAIWNSFTTLKRRDEMEKSELDWRTLNSELGVKELESSI